MQFVLLLLQCFCSYLKLFPSYPLVSILPVFKRPNNVTSSSKHFCGPLTSHNTFYNLLMALTLLFTSLSVYFPSLLLLNIMDLNLWSASLLLDVSVGVLTGTQFAPMGSNEETLTKWLLTEVRTDSLKGTNEDREHLPSSYMGKPLLPWGQEVEGKKERDTEKAGGQELCSPGSNATTAANLVPRREGAGKKHSDLFFYPLISGACQNQLKGSRVGCLQGSASRAQSRALKGGELQTENS